MKISLIVFLILISGMSFSQNQGILWMVYKSDMKDTSYIFGTKHTIDDTILIPTKVKKTLSKASVFFGEDKKEFLSNLKLSSILFKNGIKTNQTQIDFVKYQNFKKFCLDSLNIPINKLEFLITFRPMLAIEELNKYAFKKLNINKKTYLLDDSIAHIAKKYKLDIKGLENAKQLKNQINLMSFKDEFDLYITSNINDTTTINDFIVDKYNYLLGKSFLCGLHKDLKPYELGCFSPMVMNRNFSWIPEIELNMRKKSVFVCVGIGHVLPETYGLIDLLRAKGYTVECIMKEFK
jgi:uncharacterized protein YbaP (TraB family)